MNIDVQKAVKNNGQEMSSFLQDLRKWSQQMKAQELAETISIEEAQSSASGHSSTPKEKSTVKTKCKDQEEPPKKRAPLDYKSWEKFDVEKACKEVDSNEKDKLEGLTEDQLVKKKAVLLRLKNAANEKKELGNGCIKDKNYERAIGFYTEGIKLDPTNAVLYANRAQAYLNTNENSKAHEDCDKALALDSTYVKAVFRRAKAFIGLGKESEAKADLKLTLSLNPRNAEAIQILNGLMAKKVVKKPIKELTTNSQFNGTTSESVRTPQPQPDSSKSATSGSYDFDSEMRVRSVKRFIKPQGGGDGIIESTFPRYIQPIKKRENLQYKAPLYRVPVKIVGKAHKVTTISQ